MNTSIANIFRRAVEIGVRMAAVGRMVELGMKASN
jgi:hypothetical protein